MVRLFRLILSTRRRAVVTRQGGRRVGGARGGRDGDDIIGDRECITFVLAGHPERAHHGRTLEQIQSATPPSRAIEAGPRHRNRIARCEAMND